METGVPPQLGVPPKSPPTLVPISASINLISNEKPVIFAEEVEMK
jgi:hypothetical protein